MNSIIDQIHSRNSYNSNTICCLFSTYNHILHQSNQKQSNKLKFSNSQPKDYHKPKGILLTKRTFSENRANQQVSHYSSQRQLKNNSQSTKILNSLGSNACSRRGSTIQLAKVQSGKLNGMQVAVKINGHVMIGGKCENIKVGIMNNIKNRLDDDWRVSMVSQIPHVQQQFISNGSASISNMKMILNLTQPSQTHQIKYIRSIITQNRQSNRYTNGQHISTTKITTNHTNNKLKI